MNNDLLEVLEGLLYLSGDEGIDLIHIKEVLEVDKKMALELIEELIEVYENKTVKGLKIVNYGGKYKIITNPIHKIYYQKLIDQKTDTLSNAALETLAIIAYNQPITRSQIEDIRGVGSDSMIRKLLAKALIKDVGRNDSPGLPMLYAITDEFMDAFGLVSLDELPELEMNQKVIEDENLFDTKYREDDE